MSRLAIAEPSIIAYRPLPPTVGTHRCFCHRAATWEKRAGEVFGYLCDGHWKLWRQRFEADPGPCRLYRMPSSQP